MNETVAKIEELSDLWNPGAMDGTPPFVMNLLVSECSYLFHLFDFYCSVVQDLFFSRKFASFVPFL